MEYKLNTVLCCVNKLKNTLKVNTKKLNTLELKEELENRKDKCTRKAVDLRLLKYSKRESSMDGLSSWNLSDD